MNIEIYGQTACCYCEDAVSYCTMNGLPFVYRDIGDPIHRKNMFRRNSHAKTIPQIFVGGRLIGGFDNLAGFSISQLQQMIGGT